MQTIDMRAPHFGHRGDAIIRIGFAVPEAILYLRYARQKEVLLYWSSTNSLLRDRQSPVTIR